MINPKAVNLNLEEIKNRISKYFSTMSEIKTCYVFGSIAKGEENKLSDIDIAILVDEEKVPRDLPYGYKANVLVNLIGVLKTEKVDLVILNESPLFLCFQVVRDGLIVCSKDEKSRIQFEAKIMSRYFDQQYYFERHAEATINRIAEEGIL